MLMAFLLVGTIGVGVNAYGQHSIDIEFDCPVQKVKDTQGCGRLREKVPHKV